MWETLDEKRACRIRYIVSIGGYGEDEEKWPQAHEALVKCNDSFGKGVAPVSKNL